MVLKEPVKLSAQQINRLARREEEPLQLTMTTGLPVAWSALMRSDCSGGSSIESRFAFIGHSPRNEGLLDVYDAHIPHALSSRFSGPRS